MAHTLFISDIHLHEHDSATAEAFLRFLEEQAPKADALYILGDFFNAWIGDDDQTPFHQKIIASLKQASIQTEIYFLRGNRDFLIGNRFLQETGCHLLEDPTPITLYNKHILISHGDFLCTDDILHQIYRKILINPFTKKLFLLLPIALRRSIGKNARYLSKRYTGKKVNTKKLDVNEKTVLKWLKKYRTDLLIHGHTHKPAIHEHGTHTRIVLSDWHRTATYLSYYDDHHIVQI